MATASARMPALYIPHGGGPCFFMPEGSFGPPGTWAPLRKYLESLLVALPRRPEALLMVSAHWEENRATVQTGTTPPLLFDYHGFPPSTYALKWPARGAPAVAQRVRRLLEGAGLPVAEDAKRGYDHGVFVPGLLFDPDASIPCLQLSLVAGLDPDVHLRIGAALAPLRDEGVLIVGSGMSFHNMSMLRTDGDAAARGGAVASPDERFDAWLTQTLVTVPRAEREQRLRAWADAPAARTCHPREEHLLPLMVVAGAAGKDTGQLSFSDRVLGARVSGYTFSDAQCAS